MSEEYPMAHKIKRPFAWIPASSHGTSEAFAARQRARIEAAKSKRKAAVLVIGIAPTKNIKP